MSEDVALLLQHVVRHGHRVLANRSEHALPSPQEEHVERRLPTLSDSSRSWTQVIEGIVELVIRLCFLPLASLDDAAAQHLQLLVQEAGTRVDGSPCQPKNTGTR